MWDNRYRQLSKGEIICEGDEVDNSDGRDDGKDEAKWEPTRCVGMRAPDPQFPAHSIYRRLIQK
jgi:hypothetical protein